MNKTTHCKCGAELKPDEGAVCHKCILKMMHENRPSFFKPSEQKKEQ